MRSGEAEMKNLFRASCVVIVASLAFAGGAWAQAKTQGHPVLDRAIEQIDTIKGRLEGAPKDFGGHKQKAIDALTLAANELQQAKQFAK
jgi:hypothetical protein